MRYKLFLIKNSLKQIYFDFPFWLEIQIGESSWISVKSSFRVFMESKDESTGFNKNEKE
jgi:hypothetical protein